MRRRDRQAGQASVVLVGVLLLGLAFTGLAVDGARLFTARRDLQNVADSAALAGASAIDEARFRETDGAEVRLDAGCGPRRGRAGAAARPVLPSSDRRRVDGRPRPGGRAHRTAGRDDVPARRRAPGGADRRVGHRRPADRLTGPITTGRPRSTMAEIPNYC